MAIARNLGITASLLIWAVSPVLASLESAKHAYQRRDYPQAVSEFMPLAEQGDADAQVYLGLMYATGRGVQKDLLAAARWYRLAADQGHRDAQFNLGLMYAKGLGVPVNYAAAVRLYRDAAEQHHAAAQLNLGVCYSRGYGVLRDEEIAAEWFARAAELGNAAAQFNLGLMYAEGRGVSQDAAQAADWYRLAAEQGHTAAQLNLGVCYERGLGVARDLEAAATWYRLAAASGDSDARFNLARLEARDPEVEAASETTTDASAESQVDEIDVPAIDAAAGDGSSEDAAALAATENEIVPEDDVGEIVTHVETLAGRVDRVVDAADEPIAEAPQATDQPVDFFDGAEAGSEHAALAWRNRGYLPRADGELGDESAVP